MQDFYIYLITTLNQEIFTENKLLVNALLVRLPELKMDVVI